MLQVFYKKPKGTITYSSGYFDFNYQDDWIVSDFGRKVLKTIDNADVINENMASSPMWGILPITSISGGSKALFIAKYTDLFISSVCFGDNCVPILLDICEEKDVKLVFEHPIDIPDEYEKPIYFPEYNKMGKMINVYDLMIKNF